MIVGNGILAKVFQSADWCNDEYLVIASGVSNSAEIRPAAYQREKDLINSFLPTNKWVIYFSTVSIFQEEKQNTAYIKYKIEIEEYLQNTCEKLLILRLPIVVSKENNPSQLIGYLNSKIANKETIHLFKNTSRYFFLLYEISTAAKCIIDSMNSKGEKQKAINVGFGHQIRMEKVGELITQKFPDVPVVSMDEGEPYFVDFNEFETIVSQSNMNFKSESPIDILSDNLG